MEKEGTKGTTREKLPDNKLRRTLIIQEKHSDFIDRVAYWDRKYVMEVVGEALDEYMQKYKRKNGMPEPVPGGKMLRKK